MNRLCITEQTSMNDHSTQKPSSILPKKTSIQYIFLINTWGWLISLGERSSGLRLSHHRQQQHGKQRLLLRTTENWVTLGQPWKFDDSIPTMSSLEYKASVCTLQIRCSMLKQLKENHYGGFFKDVLLGNLSKAMCLRTFQGRDDMHHFLFLFKQKNLFFQLLIRHP